jgi:hypothetical protein
MRMKPGLTLIILALLTTGAASGQDGLALMKVESGSRPAGMGGAFVSIASDPNATFYNPAGAMGTERFMVSFGHNTYWDNIRIETGYYATNLTDQSWLHGSLRYAAVDNIESRRLPTLEPDALFSAYDVSFKGGFTTLLFDRLAAGVSLGWYVEKIDVYRGSSFNVDLGALYQRTENLAFGASITNLGGDVSLSLSGQEGTEDIPLPTTYRLGGSYRYEKYLGAADIVILDDDTHLHLGAEGKLHEYFDLRVGYMFGYDSKDVTAGASFHRRNFTIDYAFVPYSNNLGTSHLFNLTITL